MPENLQTGAKPLMIAVPDELASLRPDLQRFFDAMIYKLRRNKNKGRWEDLNLERSFELLQGEVVELDQALAEGSSVEVLMEAADVANFALIVANIGLEAKDKANAVG